MEEYFEGKKFDRISFAEWPRTPREYEDCTFIDCDFENANLTDVKFSDCELSGCNLSLAKLHDTAFRDVKFVDCKMLGLRFDHCSQFGFAVHFDNCVLGHSSFRKLKLKTTTFKNSRMQEADFTESDLTGSIFDGCDLTRAVFHSTILEKADFRTASNYSIDPEANRIRKAKFSLTGVAGLLAKYEIEIDLTG
jgi:fluoroquinolone resistance protein